MRRRPQRALARAALTRDGSRSRSTHGSSAGTLTARVLSICRRGAVAGRGTDTVKLTDLPDVPRPCSTHRGRRRTPCSHSPTASRSPISTRSRARARIDALFVDASARGRRGARRAARRRARARRTRSRAKDESALLIDVAPHRRGFPRAAVRHRAPRCRRSRRSITSSRRCSPSSASSSSARR